MPSSAYENASVIGLISDGKVVLNPTSETLISPGDQVIAIAQDDSVLAVAARFVGEVSEGLVVAAVERKGAPQRILLLGWNSGTADLLNELDAHVPPGSQAVLVSDYAEAHTDLHERCSDLRHLELRVRDGNTSRRRILLTLDVASFDHILVLAYSDQLSVEKADAKSIMTLLHLREMLADHEPKPSVVSEVLDERNRKLAQVADVDDVIVSDRLISLLVSQLSENRVLDLVFRELFSAGGCEIHLRPAPDYVSVGVPLPYATVVEAARRRGETAIGFRIGSLAHDVDARYGVRVNPFKSEVFEVDQRDSVIVLAAETK